MVNIKNIKAIFFNKDIDKDSNFLKKIKWKSAKISWQIVRTFLLIGLCFVLIYPLIYMLSNAFKPIVENYDTSVIWIPKSFTFNNFIDAIVVIRYWDVLKNTVIIGVLTAIFQIMSCMIVGYGFARFKFYGRGILFVIVLLTIIVPPQTIAIPQYIDFRYFDFFGLFKLLGIGSKSLLDTYWAFYLPAIFGMGLRSGIYIFVFRQFFRGLPKELEDAASIDGCNAFKTFYKVMLPNAGAAVLTVFLFSIVWQWSDYYGPQMFFANKSTISTALANFTVSAATLPGVTESSGDPMVLSTRIQAACLLSVFPMLLLYLILQRYFVESIERTGIVG